MQVTGIILAGGKSSRMGKDKALLNIQNNTLLENAIEICQTFCHSILISSNNPAHQKSGFKIVPDEIRNCGPIGGIYSCLKKSKTDWNFLISVDSPFVEIDFINYLLDETGDFDAIVPLHSNGKEPLISLYHKNCIPQLEQKINSGDYKIHNLLDSLITKFVDAQIWVNKYPQLFMNINKPDDLEFINKLLNKN